MNDIAIRFDHVGKLYKLGLVGTGTLSHDLNRWWKTTILRQEDPYLKIGETNDRSKKGASEYVWALKDITFDVHQGDVVGIIGKNGAGKSTLLKLLSRVTSPTTGAIRARGRIASLLEVGTGFHPELTGRENIYMNGSIMGMTRHEISHKLDEIVDFAGVERYVDTPVKRYSIDTPLPSALKPSTVYFFGQALVSFQLCTGPPLSSRRATVTLSRWMTFIFTLLIQSQSFLSSLNIAFFRVTSPLLRKPGILTLVNPGMSPERYSITSNSTSSPDTSLQEILPTFDISTLK